MTVIPKYLIAMVNILWNNEKIITFNSGTACKGCSPTHTKSLPTPLSIIRCLVTFVSSLSTSNTPTPGVITTDNCPVLSKLRSK